MEDHSKLLLCRCPGAGISGGSFGAHILAFFENLSRYFFCNGQVRAGVNFDAVYL